MFFVPVSEGDAPTPTRATVFEVPCTAVLRRTADGDFVDLTFAFPPSGAAAYSVGGALGRAPLRFKARVLRERPVMQFRFWATPGTWAPDGTLPVTISALRPCGGAGAGARAGEGAGASADPHSDSSGGGAEEERASGSASSSDDADDDDPGRFRWRWAIPDFAALRAHEIGARNAFRLETAGGGAGGPSRRCCASSASRSG